MRFDMSGCTSVKRRWYWWTGLLLLLSSALMKPMPVLAQVQLTPTQLDQLVARVALYPDPLLAQVLAASSYSDQISEAATWADQHGYLTGDGLAKAISEDNLPWDPSVQALLPFPTVLDMMSSNISWARQLGDAVLGQRPDVMDAVQRMRQRARDFGYLQDGPQYHVVATDPGVIEILPVDAAYYYVPIYDPLIVFGRPRVGLALGMSFGPRVFIGASFAPWGWHRPGFGWPSHTITFDAHPWARTRENRGRYVHPYSNRRPHSGAREEHHELRPTHPDRHEGHHDRKS